MGSIGRKGLILWNLVGFKIEKLNSVFHFIASGITPLLASRGRYVTWRAIRLASISLSLHRVWLRYRFATTSHH